MDKNTKELYKKVAGLKDLKSAIKEVKKTLTANESDKTVEVTKNDKADDSKPQHKLKYLSRNKVANGILSHLIGTGEMNDGHYQVDVNLEKHSQKMPCISISLVSPDGQIKDQSSEQYKDMKDAMKALVGHSMKKAWK